MAFSLFNKPGEPGSTEPPRAPRAPGEGFAITEAGGVASSGAQLSSSNIPPMLAVEASSLPVTQEAAVLYAAGHGDVAHRMLKAAVAKNPANAQLWLMLLDLYQVLGHQTPFEEMAMAYASRFERSPPYWNPQFAQQPEQRRVARVASDYFALVAREKAPIAAQIAKLREFAQTRGSVRIDFAKLTLPNAQEAEQLAAVLAGLNTGGNAARVSNSDALFDSLRGTLPDAASARQQGPWQLAFELLQALGKEAEFEDLGLEYAIAFEESPPIWSGAARAAEPEAEAPSQEAQPIERNFQLRGEITPTARDQLGLLLNFAASSPQEIVVGMSGVTRIDFLACGMFVDALKAIHLTEKKLVLQDVNEMVLPLLEACGGARYATLQRRKWQ